MLRVTLKGVRGHLVRFMLTAFAVMIGVSFVAGTFVLRDSINSTLDGLFSQAGKGVDVQVRGVDTKTDNRAGGSSRAALPLTLETALSSADGVASVRPDLQGTVLLAGKDGTAVRNGGAPGLGFAYRSDDQSFTLVKGVPPTNAGEVAVEASTLAKSGLAVGDSTRALVGGAVGDVKITGEVRFGSGTLFGATAVLLDDASARKAFAPDGTVSGFSITAKPGISQETLRASVATVLPATAEAVTLATVNAEAQSTTKTALGFVTTFLLVFAGIALFVGSFIIVNTFSMLVAQRTRELALLRAIGASRGQVMRVVLGEALVIGLVGSAAGIALGVAIAAGAKAALRAFIGIDLAADLPVATSTVVWSLTVGTLVTLVAAILPAWRASRIAPVAAMRDDLTIAPKGLRLRGIVGGSLLVVGAALLTLGVTRSDVQWALAGLGAGLVVIGALVAAPLATRPVVRVIAAPFVLLNGIVGKLARENSLRVPRRTATTASALMIGLALIAAVSVVAQSTKASVAGILAREITSDFVLTAGGGGTPVPSTIAPAAAQVPGVASVAALSGVGVRIGDIDSYAAVSTARGLADNLALTLRAGSLDVLDSGEVLVSETAAKDHKWAVGSVLADASVGTLTGQRLTVGGIYKDSQALGSELIVDQSLYAKAVPASQQGAAGLYLRVTKGADLQAVRAALTTLVKPYLIVSVEDGSEYQNSAASGIDTLLNLLYVLLLFSVIVAVLGIINTLALSVFERTREIGLLRAVGLRRRQLSGMITIEAVSTALFGAVLGTALGLGLGIALQHGLSSSGLNTLAIPWGTVIVVLVTSAVVGVLAAVLPAIRAVRLNVLAAIATE